MLADDLTAWLLKFGLPQDRGHVFPLTCVEDVAEPVNVVVMLLLSVSSPAGPAWPSFPSKVWNQDLKAGPAGNTSWQLHSLPVNTHTCTHKQNCVASNFKNIDANAAIEKDKQKLCYTSV